MFTGNPIEIALVIFAVCVAVTAVAAVLNGIVDKNRAVRGTGGAVNGNDLPSRRAEGSVRHAA